MNTEKKQPEKLWTKDFVIVIFLNFFAFSTHLMILSTFPFFVNYLGYSESISGICSALFSFTAVIIRPFIGWVMDNGRRKLILLIGVVSMAILPMGYLLVYTIFASIALTVLLRILHGAAFACANTAAATVATDVVPKSRFSEGLGMFGLSTALATACAPAFGEALMNLGFITLYVAATIIMAIGFVMFLCMNPSTVKVEKKPLRIRELINSDAMPASATALFFIMTYGSQESYILKFATTVDDVTLTGGTYFLVMAVFLFITRFSVGKIADEYGEAPFVYSCCPLMTVALLILAFIPGNVAFLIAAACSGASFGCMEPALQAMAVSISTPARRGSANSTFLCAYDIGMGLGAGFAGVLIDLIGYRHMYIVLSMTSLVALAVYLIFGRHHPSSITWARKQARTQAEN